MSKLILERMESIQGGKITPNWADCTVLTIAAGATLIWATPMMGLMVGGMAVGCWNKMH